MSCTLVTPVTLLQLVHMITYVGISYNWMKEEEEARLCHELTWSVNASRKWTVATVWPHLERP